MSFPSMPPSDCGAAGKSPCRIPPDGDASSAPCTAGKFPRMPPGEFDSNEAASRGLGNALVSPNCDDGVPRLCNHQGSGSGGWGAPGVSGCVGCGFHGPNAAANPSSSASDGMFSPVDLAKKRDGSAGPISASRKRVPARSLRTCRRQKRSKRRARCGLRLRNRRGCEVLRMLSHVFRRKTPTDGPDSPSNSG